MTFPRSHSTQPGKPDFRAGLITVLAGAGRELGLAFTIHHSLMQQLLTQYLPRIYYP